MGTIFSTLVFLQTIYQHKQVHVYEFQQTAISQNVMPSLSYFNPFQKNNFPFFQNKKDCRQQF